MAKSFFEKLTGFTQAEDRENDYTEAPTETKEEVGGEDEYLDDSPEKESVDNDAEEDVEEEEENEEKESNAFPETDSPVEAGEVAADLALAKTRASVRVKTPTAVRHDTARKAKEPIETTNLSFHEESEGQLAIDVYQTEDEIVIKSTIAGVDPKGIDVSITSDTVTIRGTRQKDERVSGENYFYQECYWGTFSRSVILPMEIDADNAVASFKNGILTIRLPKIHKNKEKKLSIVEG